MKFCQNIVKIIEKDNYSELDIGESEEKLWQVIYFFILKENCKHGCINIYHDDFNGNQDPYI